MDDKFKNEIKGSIESSIKANLEAITGKEIADRVEKAVESLRLERLINGRDVTGLSDEQKKEFAAAIQAVARGEKAAYLPTSDQAGGYLVPTEVHDGILRIAETVGLITRDARRWAMSTDELEIPRYTGSVMQGEYVGEDDEGDESQSDLGVARLHTKTWMTIFRISNTLMQDASVSLADWLMTMAAEGLAYRIDREGFMGGTYAGSPFVGLLGSDQITTQTLGSGKTGFEDFDLTEASVAVGSLKTAALVNAAFYFNPTTWAQIRVQKSGDNFVFGQNQIALNTLRRENGIQPVGEILGYPVYTTEVLPAYSASGTSKKFGVFGNLELALAWGDRGPMQIAKSDSATVGGKSVFRANQTAMRFTHRHSVAIQLPGAAIALKTAAG